jgi:hypothetical protein
VELLKERDTHAREVLKSFFLKFFSCGDRCGGDVHSPSGSARIRLLKKNTITLSNGVIPSIFFLMCLPFYLFSTPLSQVFLSSSTSSPSY